MDHLRALLVLELLRIMLLGMLLDTIILVKFLKRKRPREEYENQRRYSIKARIPKQMEHLDDIINAYEKVAIFNLRMGRDAFGRLCIILKQLGGLSDTRGVTVPEQICLFLSVISHHKKNRIVFFDFKRSARTVSIHFHSVLKAILKLHSIFTPKAEPIEANSTDDRRKHFKCCLGALDGTLIEVCIGEADKARYRSRKGKCHVNVLGVVNTSINFVYVLTGWEGSAADGRVLRDAIQRPNGFKVPRGNFYLCDAGYTNGEGFLAPYRSTRYHLQEWGSRTPQNFKELFNLRHAKARNIIERAFGILKKRWAILRSPSFYRIRTQNQIIMACCLLHNFIRGEMEVDPVELELREEDLERDTGDPSIGYIPHIETSTEWTNFRDNLANSMCSIIMAYNGSQSQSHNVYCSQPPQSQSTSKKTNTRRSWTLLEEKVLIHAFKDIMASGWKTPNGFRTGFLQQLEQRMKQALPGTDLTANPMIVSKYGTWKRTYRDVFNVLSKTGLGWNSTTKTVQAEPEVWDSLIQAYPDLKYVREKPFPFYETWVEMYCKDGATGNTAFDMRGAPNDEQVDPLREDEQVNINGSPSGVYAEHVANSESPTPRPNNAPTNDKGKRKRADTAEEVIEVISTMWAKATDSISEVAKSLASELESTQNRKKLYEAIGNRPITLTRADRLRVTCALAKQKDQLDVFFELPDDAKCDMVYWQLDAAMN